MSRVRVTISSVDRDLMSSGMSSHVSSGGWSGVVSIADSPEAAGAVDDDACVSGFCSLLALFSSGGGFGGCVEDMAVMSERVVV